MIDCDTAVIAMDCLKNCPSLQQVFLKNTIKGSCGNTPFAFTTVLMKMPHCICILSTTLVKAQNEIIYCLDHFLSTLSSTRVFAQNKYIEGYFQFKVHKNLKEWLGRSILFLAIVGYHVIKTLLGLKIKDEYHCQAIPMGYFNKKKLT